MCRGDGEQTHRLKNRGMRGPSERVEEDVVPPKEGVVC